MVLYILMDVASIIIVDIKFLTILNLNGLRESNKVNELNKLIRYPRMFLKKVHTYPTLPTDNYIKLYTRTG